MMLSMSLVRSLKELMYSVMKGRDSWEQIQFSSTERWI
ncbi:unnamed protein product [Arabidopsis halleri]